MTTNQLISIVADAHSRRLRCEAEHHRQAAQPRVNR
jgi:hypothetical protein